MTTTGDRAVEATPTWRRAVPDEPGDYVCESPSYEFPMIVRVSVGLIYSGVLPRIHPGCWWYGPIPARRAE